MKDKHKQITAVKIANWQYRFLFLIKAYVKIKPIGIVESTKGIEYLINVEKCCIFDPKKIIIVTIVKAVKLINKDAKKTLLLILLNFLFLNKLNKIIETKNRVIINIEL